MDGWGFHGVAAGQVGVDYAIREGVYRIASEAKWDVLKWVVGLAPAQISLLVGVLIKLL